MAGLAELFLGAENPFAQWANSHSNYLGALGAGIGSGQNIQSGLSNGLAMVPQARQLDREAAEKAKADAKVTAQQNATKAWLKANYPQYADLPVDQGFQLALKDLAGSGDDPYTLGPGQTRFGANNQPLASVPVAEKPPAPPSGYTWGTDGKSLVALPGGPADPALSGKGDKLQLAEDTKANATATVLTAAKTAADLASKRGFLGDYGNVGLEGAAGGFNPTTDAAELRRQVAVLKSTASISSLNAMRAQSPTGGALGNVTEKENQMLADSAGAINPDASAEQFQAQLDNYVHTLLRVINGPQMGDQMFLAYKGGGQMPAQAAPQGGGQTYTYNPQTGELE